MPLDQTSKLIAIIDDDEAMQDSLRDLLEAACLIVDVRMPKMSGLELQAQLQEEECNVPIIFITAHGDARMRIQAMRRGAVEFLAKPFDHQLLLKRVRSVLSM
jgi:FixJ family two-component response regulator